jgi:hypothetical protein
MDALDPTQPEDPNAMAAAPNPSTIEAQEGEAPEVEDDDEDQQLLTEFQGLVETPTFLKVTFREMDADRKYVSQDAMMAKTQDSVATNHILRNQYVGLSYLGVADPQPFVQPSRTVGSFYPPEVKSFAETMEIHLSRVAGQIRLGEKTEGACQDASTNGLAWIKINLQADYMKDPIGKSRFNDQQDSVAEYQALAARVEAGEITEDSAEMKKYTDLDQTLRIYAAGKLEEQIQAVPVMKPMPMPVLDQMGMPVIDPITGAPATQMQMVPDPTDPREVQRQAIVNGEQFDILGLPEMEHYVGFSGDQIQPEDMRWDWATTRPEDFYDCDWMAHRVYMHSRDVFAKFKSVKQGDLHGVDLYDKDGGVLSCKYGGAASSESLDPAMRPDLESTAINGRMAVWELWHKRLGRRYVFIPGAKKFLINEVPQATGRRWYPFFGVWYNRVTGWAVPLSDVKLQRSSQDEYNTLRSHEREARRASYPVLFIPKNLMDKTALDNYRNRLPFSVIEVDAPDEVKKHMQESVTIPFNGDMFRGGQATALSDLHAMAGIPQVAAGGSSGEDLASAIALSKEGMETGVARRRILVNRVITDIFQYIAEISVRVFSESAMKMTCGQLAVWPRLTVEELYTQLSIEVKGGLSGQPRAKDRIDLWTNFAGICQQLQLPVNGGPVLRELLEAMAMRLDYHEFLMVPPPMPMGGPPGPGGPGMPPPGPGGGGAPAQQGNHGHSGGAPTMVDRGAPSSINQVPNHPKPQMPPHPGAPINS